MIKLKNKRISFYVVICCAMMIFASLFFVCPKENNKVYATDFTSGWTTIGASTVSLATGNYYLNGNVTITSKLTIDEGANVVIDLNGYVLNGNGSNRVIDNNGTLTIQNSNPSSTHYFTVTSADSWTWNDSNSTGATPASSLTALPSSGVVSVSGGCITGGITTSESYAHGAGIYNAGTLNMTGGSIVACKAGDEGGGVYNCGTLNMTGGSIIGCSASSGGAIYSESSKVSSIGGISVIACNASSLGGAMYLSDQVASTVQNVNFLACTSESSGGALFVDSNLNIYSCTFNRNHAQNSGGAVYVNCSYRCILQGCTLINNDASSGGAIYSCSIASTENQTVSNAVITLVNTTITNNSAKSSGGGVYVDLGERCYTEGTKITMADGTTKNIEDVNYGEKIKTFDHSTGELSSEGVVLIHEGCGNCKVAVLTFDSGKDLQIIGSHDLFEKASRKYVAITPNNAESYVGKQFYNATENSWDTLIDVSVVTKECNYYALITAHHLNCIANDMLTLVQQVDMLTNIFEFDENLKIDENKLKRDIEEYGLLDYEDAYDATAEEYEIFNMKYVNIALGKGLLTKGEIYSLLSQFRAITGKTNNSSAQTKLTKSSANPLSKKVMLLSENYRYNSFGEASFTTDTSSSKLIIGSGVTIENNTVNNAKNNVQLASGAEIYIVLNAENSHVGVTTYSAPEKESPKTFITEGTKGCSGSFFSDADYYIGTANDNGTTCNYVVTLEEPEDEDEDENEDLPATGIFYNATVLNVSGSVLTVGFGLLVVLFIKRKKFN